MIHENKRTEVDQKSQYYKREKKYRRLDADAKEECEDGYTAGGPSKKGIP